MPPKKKSAQASETNIYSALFALVAAKGWFERRKSRAG
jgi:hypothetical protein